MSQIKEFYILDLFCGAGGFSYGMHKNSHFKTVVAIDFNEKAADTFKKNMPDTEVIVGDITDDKTKDRKIKGRKYDYRWPPVPRIFNEREKIRIK